MVPLAQPASNAALLLCLEEERRWSAHAQDEADALKLVVQGFHQDLPSPRVSPLLPAVSVYYARQPSRGTTPVHQFAHPIPHVSGTAYLAPPNDVSSVLSPLFLDTLPLSDSAVAQPPLSSITSVVSTDVFALTVQAPFPVVSPRMLLDWDGDRGSASKFLCQFMQVYNMPEFAPQDHNSPRFVTGLMDVRRSCQLYVVAVPCFMHGTEADNLLAMWGCTNNGYVLLDYVTRFVNKSGKSTIFRNLRSLVTINQGLLLLSAFFVEIRRLTELIEQGGVVVDRALLIIVAIYGLSPRYQTIRDESTTTRGSSRYNTITLTELDDECQEHNENAENLAIEEAPLISGSNVAPAGDQGFAVLTREQVDILVARHNADPTFCPVSRATHICGHLALLDMGFVKNVAEAARQKVVVLRAIADASAARRVRGNQGVSASAVISITPPLAQSPPSLPIMQSETLATQNGSAEEVLSVESLDLDVAAASVWFEQGRGGEESSFVQDLCYNSTSSMTNLASLDYVSRSRLSQLSKPHCKYHCTFYWFQRQLFPKEVRERIDRDGLYCAPRHFYRKWSQILVKSCPFACVPKTPSHQSFFDPYLSESSSCLTTTSLPFESIAECAHEDTISLGNSPLAALDDVAPVSTPAIPHPVDNFASVPTVTGSSIVVCDQGGRDSPRSVASLEEVYGSPLPSPLAHRQQCSLVVTSHQSVCYQRRYTSWYDATNHFKTSSLPPILHENYDSTMATLLTSSALESTPSLGFNAEQLAAMDLSSPPHSLPLVCPLAVFCQATGAVIPSEAEAIESCIALNRVAQELAQVRAKETKATKTQAYRARKRRR